MNTPLRTVFLDYDARRNPRTNHFCVRCQRDLKAGQSYRTVHIVNGGAFVLHPDDEANYVTDSGDCGFFSIGMDCAKIIGMEYTSAP